MNSPAADAYPELAALADGSLAGKPSERLFVLLRSSPALQAALDEQRRALELIDSAAQVRAPDSLRRRLEAMHEPRWRLILAAPRVVRTGLAAAALAGLAAVAIAIGLSGGGPQALTVQQAVALTLSPATMPPPAKSRAHRSQLSVSVQGLAFPYWENRFGWRSNGERLDRIEGRSVSTVFYTDGLGRRIGYAIVSGPALPTHGGTLSWRGGVAYRLLRHAGATVVAWRRGGHLCVISGRGVDAATLLRLASV